MTHDPNSGSWSRPPEQPRSEPEILPPDGRAQGPGGRRRPDPNARVFVYVDRDGNTQRVNVSTPGPFTIILVLLAVALVTAVLFAFILGALFFLIPVAAIAVAALIGWLYARNFWRRLRGRAGP